MARLLSLFMIFALVATQGSSVAAAACRHENAHEHALARVSADRAVAAVSLREDAAAAAAAKKASHSDNGAGHWPAQLLPGKAEQPPLRTLERAKLRPLPQRALSSTAIAPLLEPPSA
jgi:hypothetical protein